jgi:CSLREA domain-containing protein
MHILFRCTAASLLLVSAVAAHAQANDDWADRTQIVALPFDVTTPMTGATTDASDPVPNCQGTSQSSNGTIWFGYTTGESPEFLTLRVEDFQVATVLAVYTGGPGTFRLAPGACARAGGSPNNAQLAGVRLAANTAYSILLSAQSPIAGLGVHFTMDTAVLYNVTTTDDTFEGHCAASCSLRLAIEAANVTAGAVIVPAGTYVLSIAGINENANATGDLDIRNDMGIYGDGMGQTIIDANGIDRVLDVVSGAQDANTLILGDLTLTHGYTDDNDPLSGGGGIQNEQPLVPGFIGLERVALVDNHARLTGGGLDTASSGTIRESRFTLNTVNSGAGGSGGGAFLFNPQDRPFEIESSTFDDNDGGDTGGAVMTGSNLRLTNSTISGNHVAQYGGGIRAFGGLFEMSSTTVAFNQAGNEFSSDSGGGLFLDGSGYTFELYNNIVAGNTAGDCSRYPFSSAIESHHNHVQEPSSCTFAGTGDVVGTDPQLAPLADNGGPTPTHALAYQSPARDAGDPAGCNAPDGLPLVNDQRGTGFPRLDGVCDKGAYEQSVLFANGFEQ